MNENKTPVQPLQDTKAKDGVVTETQYIEPQGDDEDALERRAKLWKQRFQDAQSNQQNQFKKYSDWFGMMYAANDTPKMALWRSRAFLPILAAKTWDLVARFVQYKPSWEVKLFSLPTAMPTAELQQYLSNASQRYDKIKMKLDYDYDDPARKVQIQEEHFSTLVDAVVTGTGIARIDYRQKPMTQKEHPLDVFGNPDLSQTTKTDTQRGYNNYESINIFNFYKSPDSTNIQDGWLVVKDTASKAELLNMPGYNQDIINATQFGGITDPNAIHQQNKRRLEGTPDPLTADSTAKKAWVFDCWDTDSNMHTVYLMGGGDGQWQEIFREENPYFHGKIPYVRFTIRQKPHVFWGESIFENSETLQLAMNDLFNHYLDSYNMADGMLAVEEGSVVEPYIVEPGGEFRYRGEKPSQLKFPEPNPAQLTTIMNRIDGIIENVTISQYASGVPNSSTDKTAGTATGVTKLMEAATEKIGMMRANIRRSWADVGNMWLMNSQQFMSEPVPVERQTGRGLTVDIISPTDLYGNYILRIDESSFEPTSQSEKRDNYIAYIANVQAWSQASREQATANGTTDGIINIDYLNAVERFSELSSENAGSILLEAPVNQMVDEEGQGIGMEATPNMMDSLEPAEGLDLDSLMQDPNIMQGMNSGMSTPDMQMMPEMAM